MANPEPANDRATVEVLPPLWYRIATGRVLWWRIRRALNRLRWRRRHAARRALRWTERHPEVEQMLASDGVLRLVVARLRNRRSRSERLGVAYRPRVIVDETLDIGRLRDQPLVDDVDIVVRRGGALTHRRIVSGTGAVLRVANADAADLDAAGGATVALLAAVDLRRWTPWWFRFTPTGAPISLRQLPDMGGDRSERRRLETAHRATAVICDADPSASAAETAFAIAELAASGAPLAGELSQDVAGLLGAPLATAIGDVDAQSLHHSIARERHSIRLRRLAQRDFGPRGTWRRIGAATGSTVSAEPSVSVLLPSNRASDVVDAARQVAAQLGVEVQLIVGLHGAHMSHELDEQLAAVFPGDLVVRHLPDEMSLGQVLNEITEHAEGELVSKWDDDDWYDRWHLQDLVLALEYSQAALVAKSAEFVYLEALDLTVRRFVTGSERFSTTVAGGTLLLTRRDLQAARWSDAPRRVDRLLIDALEATGRATYRTHGFGYVLRRRASAQHTWEAGDSYFLRQAQYQRSGLDLAFAGFGEAGR